MKSWRKFNREMSPRRTFLHFFAEHPVYSVQTKPTSFNVKYSSGTDHPHNDGSRALDRRFRVHFRGRSERNCGSGNIRRCNVHRANARARHVHVHVCVYVCASGRHTRNIGKTRAADASPISPRKNLTLPFTIIRGTRRFEMQIAVDVAAVPRKLCARSGEKNIENTRGDSLERSREERSLRWGEIFRFVQKRYFA